jgi:hypothetical protein
METCDKCNGDGEYRSDRFDGQQTCERCNGKGYINPSDLVECNNCRRPCTPDELLREDYSCIFCCGIPDEVED